MRRRAGGDAPYGGSSERHPRRGDGLCPYKCFAGGKTLAQGGIHFRCASEIIKRGTPPGRDPAGRKVVLMDRISIGELMRTLGEQDRALAAHLTEQGIPSEGKEGLIALVEKVGKLNFLPILFYDWDGVTLLGVGKARKADAPAEQQALIAAAMRDFAISQMSAEDGAAYAAAGYDPAACTDHSAEGKPLSNKAGYAFSHWTDMAPVDAAGNEAYTAFGAGIEIFLGVGVTTIQAPNDFTMPTGTVNSISVQAAYRTNAALDAAFPVGMIEGESDQWYTLEPTGYWINEGCGACSVTLTLRRGHEKDGVWTPVPRMRRSGLVVNYYNADNNYISERHYLCNGDEGSVTVEVYDGNVGIDRIVLRLVDLGISPSNNWESGSIARCKNLTLYYEDRDGVKGIKTLGAVKVFNACLVQYEAAGLADGSPIRGRAEGVRILPLGCFNWAGLNTTAPYNPESGATGTSATKRYWAVANMYEMYLSLPERRPLTKEEMQDAITYGTVWDAATGGWVDRGGSRAETSTTE